MDECATPCLSMHTYVRCTHANRWYQSTVDTFVVFVFVVVHRSVWNINVLHSNVIMGRINIELGCKALDAAHETICRCDFLEDLIDCVGVFLLINLWLAKTNGDCVNCIRLKCVKHRWIGDTANAQCKNQSLWRKPEPNHSVYNENMMFLCRTRIRLFRREIFLETNFPFCFHIACWFLHFVFFPFPHLLTFHLDEQRQAHSHFVFLRCVYYLFSNRMKR